MKKKTLFDNLMMNLVALSLGISCATAPVKKSKKIIPGIIKSTLTQEMSCVNNSEDFYLDDSGYAVFNAGQNEGKGEGLYWHIQRWYRQVCGLKVSPQVAHLESEEIWRTRNRCVGGRMYNRCDCLDQIYRGCSYRFKPDVKKRN